MFSSVETKILRLHLELDCSGADIGILQKWGKVRDGISRDVYVLSAMPLWALHFAIQRLFGWQNNHMHSFTYPQKTYNSLTENKFSRWADLCGLYFRFPTDDYEDLYWYNDYEEDVDIKKWMKKKYAPPYECKSQSELYSCSQDALSSFVGSNPTVSFDSDVYDFTTGKSMARTVPIMEATMTEVENTPIGRPRELLEYKGIGQYLCPRKSSSWKKEVEEAISESKKADKVLREKSIVLSERILNIERRMDKGIYDFKDCMDHKNAIRQLTRLIEDAQVSAVPVSDTLVYEYDFAEGWKVNITAVEEIKFDWDYKMALDENDIIIPETFDLVDSVDRRGAVCISSDGLPVMDDVGGMYGYCEFLRALHGTEQELLYSMFESTEHAKEFGKSMGWTGRAVRPENML